MFGLAGHHHKHAFSADGSACLDMEYHETSMYLIKKQISYKINGHNTLTWNNAIQQAEKDLKITDKDTKRGACPDNYKSFGYPDEYYNVNTTVKDFFSPEENAKDAGITERRNVYLKKYPTGGRIVALYKMPSLVMLI